MKISEKGKIYPPFLLFYFAGSIQQNLKHVDSAIVQFSSSTDLTRYDKADLISLKDGRLSQQPPACYYDRNIIRLNIFKYKTQHTHEMEAQMKEFREKLQNLAVTSWDSNLLHMLKNYHNALLNPLYQSNGKSLSHDFLSTFSKDAFFSQNNFNFVVI